MHNKKEANIKDRLAFPNILEVYYFAYLYRTSEPLFPGIDPLSPLTSPQISACNVLVGGSSKSRSPWTINLRLSAIEHFSWNVCLLWNKAQSKLNSVWVFYPGLLPSRVFCFWFTVPLPPFAVLPLALIHSCLLNGHTSERSAAEGRGEII